jgi:hypothetical protein
MHRGRAEPGENRSIPALPTSRDRRSGVTGTWCGKVRRRCGWRAWQDSSLRPLAPGGTKHNRNRCLLHNLRKLPRACHATDVGRRLLRCSERSVYGWGEPRVEHHLRVDHRSASRWCARTLPTKTHSGAASRHPPRTAARRSGSCTHRHHQRRGRPSMTTGDPLEYDRIRQQQEANDRRLDAVRARIRCPRRSGAGRPAGEGG